MAKAKKKIESNIAEPKIKLDPTEAKAIWNKNHIHDYSQILVDYNLFYPEHCKVHPVDLLLSKIKKAAETAERPECFFYYSYVFDNLDYEEKKIKKEGDWPETFWQKLTHKTVHHEWEETDDEHYKHYRILADNIMHELGLYLLKAGWRVEFYQPEECIKFFKIYF